MIVKLVMKLKDDISEMKIYSFPVYLINTSDDENFTKLLKSFVSFMQ